MSLCVCVCATFLFSSTISRYTCRRRRRPFQFIHLSHKAKKSFNGSPHCGTVEEREGAQGTTPKNRFMGISGLKSLKRAPTQSVEAFFFVLARVMCFFPPLPNAFTYAIPLIFPSPTLSQCLCKNVAQICKLYKINIAEGPPLLTFWGLYSCFQIFLSCNLLTVNTHNDFPFPLCSRLCGLFFNCVIDIIHNRCVCALIELFLLN